MAHWTSLLLVLLALPAAAATTADMTFTPSFGQAAVHADGELRDGEASTLRSYIDLAGNRDGNVTEAEAQSFMRSFQGTIGSQVGEIITKANVTLDARPPTSSELGGIEVRDAAGPVSGGGPVAFTFDMTLLFNATAAGQHTVRLAGRPTWGGGRRNHLSLSLEPLEDPDVA
ncbi:MAG: hypothetical protein ABR562_06170, partial [Thermoplasmatota archaeon]